MTGVPLQNRVTPFGEIVATPERGTMLGNRGILHDEHKRIVRTSQVRRWICCVLVRKGIHRTIMKPRSYTELFFLDEATAFAAGHRPCFECRRASALAYQAAWRKALGGEATADEMDRILASQRRSRGGGKKTYASAMRGLPDGTFVFRDGAAWLLHQGKLLRWTAGGYAGARDPGAGSTEVLTPPATVAVLRAGYLPDVHPSCG
jgi:hypothetical protein